MTAAVSARSTWAPEGYPRYAGASAARPLLGRPAALGPHQHERVLEASGASPPRSASATPSRAEQVASRSATSSTTGSHGRWHCMVAARATARQRADGLGRLRSVPAAPRSERPEGHDPVDAELGELLHDQLRLARPSPARSPPPSAGVGRRRRRSIGAGGLAAGSPKRAGRQPPAPSPSTSGVAGAEAQHALEVVGVVGGERGRLEVVDEHERAGVVGGVAGHRAQRNAERMRERKPASVGRDLVAALRRRTAAAAPPPPR